MLYQLYLGSSFRLFYTSNIFGQDELVDMRCVLWGELYCKEVSFNPAWSQLLFDTRGDSLSEMRQFGV